MSIGPVGAAPGAAPSVRLDSSATPPDQSADDRTVTEQSWDRLNDQRDKMIGAMTSLFGWLNGGVYLLVFLAWSTGIWLPDYRIVDGKTLMTLIGATVVQAGLAFITITRFLFPGVAGGRSS